LAPPNLHCVTISGFISRKINVINVICGKRLSRIYADYSITPTILT
jgi:hypothetical protein